MLLYLIVASLLWSFSFGLIKENLAGYDPLLVAFLRLAISAAWYGVPAPVRALSRTTIYSMREINQSFGFKPASSPW